MYPEKEQEVCYNASTIKAFSREISECFGVSEPPQTTFLLLLARRGSVMLFICYSMLTQRGETQITMDKALVKVWDIKCRSEVLREEAVKRKNNAAFSNHGSIGMSGGL